jgi:hypothetical protein
MVRLESIEIAILYYCLVKMAKYLIITREKDMKQIQDWDKNNRLSIVNIEGGWVTWEVIDYEDSIFMEPWVRSIRIIPWTWSV